METCGPEHDKDGSLSDTFWKAPPRALPGRPHPRVPSAEVMSGSSYQDFQASVNDAWDLGDDDIVSGIADAKISRSISQTVALNVINSHRNSTKVSKSDVKSDSDNVKVTEESIRRSDVRKSGGARQWPGRPRAVRASALVAGRDETSEAKLERFMQLHQRAVLDLNDLKKISWSGIPSKARAVTWRLLAGYLPANSERRAETLERKRADYKLLVRQYYDVEAERDDDTYRQIHIDIPRMSPLVALFQQRTVQVMFERILYIWAIRHPASGYVQGINDLVTPFFMVFLQEAIPDEELDNYPLDKLTETQRDVIEADSFWCLSKFLDSIQDNYIFAQLGIQYKISDEDYICQECINLIMIELNNRDEGVVGERQLGHLNVCVSCGISINQRSGRRSRPVEENTSIWSFIANLINPRQVNKLKELICRIDQPLHQHLQRHGVDYLQFSFRWMNNLLTREIPLACTIRLWDTYLAESDGFATFQLYVCAAFLLHWRERLMQERDFQGLMILLQNVPTQNWTDSNISVLVAEAYRLKFAFADAPNHLNAGKSDR